MALAGAGASPPRGRFLLRAHEPLALALVELSQDGWTLWRGRLHRLGPGRSASLPWSWANAAEAHAGPIVARATTAAGAFRERLCGHAFSGLVALFGQPTPARCRLSDDYTIRGVDD